MGTQLADAPLFIEAEVSLPCSQNPASGRYLSQINPAHIFIYLHSGGGGVESKLVWWNEWQGKPKYSEKICPDGIEPGPPRW
jgi:hypothetical protein